MKNKERYSNSLEKALKAFHEENRYLVSMGLPSLPLDEWIEQDEADMKESECERKRAETEKERNDIRKICVVLRKEFIRAGWNTACALLGKIRDIGEGLDPQYSVFGDMKSARECFRGGLFKIMVEDRSMVVDWYEENKRRGRWSSPEEFMSAMQREGSVIADFIRAARCRLKCIRK